MRETGRADAGPRAGRFRRAKPRILTTAIDEAAGTASLDLAFDGAAHFGVKLDRAKVIVPDLGKVVTQWRKIAASLGLSSKEINRMAQPSSMRN
jgi:hypothetical protein